MGVVKYSSKTSILFVAAKELREEYEQRMRQLIAEHYPPDEVVVVLRNYCTIYNVPLSAMPSPLLMEEEGDLRFVKFCQPFTQMDLVSEKVSEQYFYRRYLKR